MTENRFGAARKFGLGAMALASALAFSACAADGDSEADPAASTDEQASGAADSAEDDLPVAEATAGTSIATVGDSWMHNTLGTGSAISGALKRKGVRLDNYAIQGVMLLKNNLFGRSVTSQIQNQVIRRGSSQYKTVIATGGGNDIIENPSLQADCGKSPPGSRCQAKLEEIGKRWIQLWGQLGAAGVKDVVYVAYANAAGSAPGAAKDSGNKLAEICESQTAIRCTFIDTNDVVPGKGALSLDGIHPTTSTNNKIAAKIIAAMDAKGIAH